MVFLTMWPATLFNVSLNSFTPWTFAEWRTHRENMPGIEHQENMSHNDLMATFLPCVSLHLLPHPPLGCPTGCGDMEKPASPLALRPYRGKALVETVRCNLWSRHLPGRAADHVVWPRAATFWPSKGNLALGAYSFGGRIISLYKKCWQKNGWLWS